ncbi:MAG: hypothetical protein ACKO26_10795 [Planctomycetota bacterium]
MTNFSELEPGKQQPVEQGWRRSGMGKEPPTPVGGCFFEFAQAFSFSSISWQISGDALAMNLPF